MSARNLIRPAIALVVLLALWGAVTLGTKQGDVEQRFWVPTTAAKDVDTVIVAGAHDTIVLARATADARQVNGHPADRRMVEDLLTSLADTVASGDPVAETPASYPQVGMDSAKHVQAIARGTAVTDVIVGKAGQVYGTGYIRTSNEPQVYLVRSTLPSVASRPLDEWRDRRIGGAPKDSIARVEIQRGSKRYALTRQATAWTLTPGGGTNSMAVANFLGDLGGHSGNRVRNAGLSRFPKVHRAQAPAHCHRSPAEALTPRQSPHCWATLVQTNTIDCGEVSVTVSVDPVDENVPNETMPVVVDDWVQVFGFPIP
jgi:hypothetical protein